VSKPLFFVTFRKERELTRGERRRKANERVSAYEVSENTFEVLRTTDDVHLIQAVTALGGKGQLLPLGKERARGPHLIHQRTDVESVCIAA
jgi:hypothetical protein